MSHSALLRPGSRTGHNQLPGIEITTLWLTFPKRATFIASTAGPPHGAGMQNVIDNRTSATTSTPARPDWTDQMCITGALIPALPVQLPVGDAAAERQPANQGNHTLFSPSRVRRSAAPL
jgi:hypothetical protein